MVEKQKAAEAARAWLTGLNTIGKAYSKNAAMVLGQGTRVTMRHAAMLGPMTWLHLETADQALALSACWLAAVAPAVGAEIAVRVQGDALVFPPDMA